MNGRRLAGLLAGLALATATAAGAFNLNQMETLARSGGCPGCDLTDARLRDRLLDGADLDGADLGRAVLRRASLRGAFLRRASLSEADLYGADLTGADLSEADLSGARLITAIFDDADLTEAWLWRADLSGARLESAKGLSQAELDSACGDIGTRLPRGYSIPICPPDGGAE